jgi:hypothetical protein
MVWSRKSDCCLRCGTTTVRHGGHGLCMSCYQQDWAKEQGDVLRQYKKQWYEESKSHIDYRAKNRNNRNGPVDEVLANSGHKCSECGSSENLQIHHEDHKGHNVPKRDRNNSIENLQVLCRVCHGRLHGNVEGWSRKHEKCLMCGSTEFRHHAHGYCSQCHWKVPKQEVS